MFAIQSIKMYWEKENRTPQGAIMRRDYYKPARLDADVPLNKNGIFVNTRNYIQMDKIIFAGDFQKERAKKPWCYCEKVSDIDIPGVVVAEEEKEYIVKWYSLENGYQPVRRGYNEDYHVVGAKCQGKRICCQTAFRLRQGEAGKLLVNYRYTGYDGQHYEQYCIYFLNIVELKQNSFVCADYQKECNQLVDLF